VSKPKFLKMEEGREYKIRPILPPRYIGFHIITVEEYNQMIENGNIFGRGPKKKCPLCESGVPAKEVSI